MPTMCIWAVTDKKIEATAIVVKKIRIRINMFLRPDGCVRFDKKNFEKN